MHIFSEPMRKRKSMCICKKKATHCILVGNSGYMGKQGELGEEKGEIKNGTQFSDWGLELMEVLIIEMGTTRNVIKVGDHQCWEWKYNLHFENVLFIVPIGHSREETRRRFGYSPVTVLNKENHKSQSC